MVREDTNHGVTMPLTMPLTMPRFVSPRTGKRNLETMMVREERLTENSLFCAAKLK